MEMRDKILAHATRLFAQKGAEGTSLQEIADAVGVKKPSVLYHFPSKEALHGRVLEHLLSRWNETLPRLLKAAAREDRFDAILDETLRFFAEDRDRARLLLREALDRPAEMRQLLHVHAAPWLGVVAESIQKAQADGSMRADVDAAGYVLQVIQLVIGTFAFGPILQVLLPPATANDGEPLDHRLLLELKRVARAALLNPTAPVRTRTRAARAR
jgi:TetR/AcrR family transcriptional regulator